MLDRRLLLLAPFGIAVAGGAAFWAMLDRMGEGTFDPHSLPSPLIGKPLPAFSLPGAAGKQGFSDADVRAAGAPVLLNFFASWCVPCVQEAPLLDELRGQGVPIWGIAYKDRDEATARFLRDNGNPYARLARDEPGRAAIDFGLYGVPETYLIDRAGIVRWRWAGALTSAIVADTLRPLLRQYA
jgi:cytochrome c biogenesis protein CcmG/thiol:disulfide interchange protein DsbE